MAGPTLEFLTIPYNDNQPADLDLLDSIFSPTSLIGVKKFLSSNAQNIICLLFRIGTFIKQYSLGDKLAKDFLKLVKIGTAS